ncbi:MAG TPA: RodZ domain-containing protein [Mycobacteriales bacterium]|nr:RodZ domain-containing protein [Mycobacteriales bacterium]
MKAGSVTVGETLSRARRQHGLTVDDVAAQTCIRAALISAIESDQFGPCGGAVYARGHIRSIARVVGVDPEPLIAEFDGESDAEPPPHGGTPPPLAAGPGTAYERRRPNWTLATGVALVIICGIALVPLLTHHGSKAPAHSVGAGQQTTTNPTTHKPTKKSHQPSASSVAQIPADKATMAVRALRGQTWLSISTSSGKRLFYGTLAAGQEKVFTNRTGLTFVIGYAPAVDVVVNGHDIGSPPSTGSVSRGNVSPGSDTIQQA